MFSFPPLFICFFVLSDLFRVSIHAPWVTWSFVWSSFVIDGVKKGLRKREEVKKNHSICEYPIDMISFSLRIVEKKEPLPRFILPGAKISTVNLNHGGRRRIWAWDEMNSGSWCSRACPGLTQNANIRTNRTKNNRAGKIGWKNLFLRLCCVSFSWTGRKFTFIVWLCYTEEKEKEWKWFIDFQGALSVFFLMLFMGQKCLNEIMYSLDV